MRFNNNCFSSFNFIHGKLAPYGSKGVLRHCHYRSDQKIGPGIVLIRIITCSCHACTTKLCFTWYYTIKEAYNQQIYGIVYNCKYSLILGSHNNWVIMNFRDYGTDNVYYEFMNINIIEGNVMNLSLIITKGNYSTIDADNSSCRGYYIIIFSSSLYTL